MTTTEIHRLTYVGPDSPRGKVYVAAWDSDGRGLVGWGPGTASPSTHKAEKAEKARAKYAEKINKGYDPQGSWVVPHNALPSDVAIAAAWVETTMALDIDGEAVFVEIPDLPTYDEAIAKRDAAVANARVPSKDIRPQLATEVDRSTAERYIADAAFVAEQKLNGDRVLVTVRDGVAVALNRNGQVRAGKFPLASLDRLTDDPRVDLALDGELIGGIFHVFDLPRLSGFVTPESPWHERRDILEHLFSTWEHDDKVRLVPVTRDAEAKRALHDSVLANGGEGVMFKHVDAPYRSGVRSDQWLKCKFVTEADVIVFAIGEEDHNSASVMVIDPDSPESVVIEGITVTGIRKIGKASLNGKERWGVKVGSVVVVRYLYATADHRLVQCRLSAAPRSDKAAAECSIDQLRYESATYIHEES